MCVCVCVCVCVKLNNLKWLIYHKTPKVGFIWFLCLMIYQLFGVIKCQSHPCRGIVVA